LLIQLFALAKKITYPFLFFLMFSYLPVQGQEKVIRDIGGRIRQVGGQRMGNTGGPDSLRKRNKLEDSLTITYRFLDSTRQYKLDSSVNDFTRRFPIPAHHIYLGNIGNATRSVLFSPEFTVGWDPGFHAFDAYKWRLERVRFFHTTRPYSKLAYLLGTRVEQIIEILHTQNITPNWNGLIQYRLINSPGFFKNQRSNHNNYLFSSKFETGNRRYHAFVVALRNKMQSAENGGIIDSIDYLKHPNPAYQNRFNIPTKLGGDEAFSSNFFSNEFNTGNVHDEITVLIRQQYDLGKKDSLVTDSTVVRLFYPRLRFEHTFQYDVKKYFFFDKPSDFYFPDSAYYAANYRISIPGDSVDFRERWKSFINDFSIIQFPDARNLHQFIRLGIVIQHINGQFTHGKESFYNLAGHAEYRNRTRNQRWDIEANGQFYFTGLNAADYRAYFSLQRLIGAKLGYLQLGFENANRTPHFIFDPRSSFYLNDFFRDFKKENNTHLFASYSLPAFQLRLTGHYYLMTNYTYIKNFYQLQQENNLFNVFRISAEKTFRLGKRWVWHTDVHLQQRIGDAEVNLPLLFTRNRIGYEGNLGFRNLDLALGTEIKYRSPYKADNYSPVLSQFFFQDSIPIRNQVPDISAYVHFRIMSFTAYIRAENLNTAQSNDRGIGFTNNNLVAPGYALPGLQFRVGIYWSFVN